MKAGMIQSSLLSGISKVDADAVAGLLKSRSGIVLDGDKSYLIESRLLPLARSRGLSSFAELVKMLRAGQDGRLLDEAIDALTTNETLFFRDIKPFRYLEKTAIPGIAARKPKNSSLRIWSAAASTGQEAYSLAMMLAENPGLLNGMRAEILATDISRASLARAREGVYSHFEVQRGIPGQLILKYFTKEGERWRLSPQLRSQVGFQEFNLLDDPKRLGRFDLILCRNVLIYFDVPTKKGILERLAGALAEGGVLILGSSESTIGISERFVQDPELNCAYRLAGGKP